ncbi:MAG: hypothetical protein A2431_03590 [Candidatus Zambryskibacteria bacterium RIFOXYC1_FULL_39_10]|uniref:Uncharacterized protein n=1 Tax=Candidatus Zambryskibacteria bacterium RIFOXYC1_FULL_39_10 TaxID=1802779 RepID=A0A1G2UYH1_9BACT|nr:MAG: hypothetical protein A2431_03590 [Candidatus Zambryskibacteria bacterium RIFOXYC1_FULL_39_10]OHB16797.1 MAG: hypothetical protein A2605_01260 [Candidatus Zambryskibacteria bacterium RIFOXYD1_FULL_39_35]
MKFQIDMNGGGLRAFNAMIDFVRSIMLSSIFQCDGLFLDLVFKEENQTLRNSHSGGVAFDRIMFSVESSKTGATLFITLNSPVNGNTPFYTLGEVTATSPSEIFSLLLGR